jgi:hypothetical protein
MWKNLKQKTYHKMVLAPVSSFAATAATSSVDCKDINSLGFVLAVGSFAFSGSNYLTVNLQESDDNSTWTDVTQVYEGTAPAPLVLNDQATQESKSHLVEYRGGKRYARLNIVETGTVTAPLSVVAISNKPELMPPQ